MLGRAQELGFVGPSAVEGQIRHGTAFGRCAEAFLGGAPGEVPGGTREPARFLDLGSGGGLPGLVLADRWEDARGVLLDSQHRRAAFLEGAVRGSGWEGRVEVVCARAEDAGRWPRLRAGFDLVVARSFGAPAVTAECAAPFLRVGGVLVVSEPPLRIPDRETTAGGGVGSGAARRETGTECRQVGGGPERAAGDRWPVRELAQLELEAVGRWRQDVGFQVLRQRAPCPERFPRRAGVPTRRPLFSA